MEATIGACGEKRTDSFSEMLKLPAMKRLAAAALSKCSKRPAAAPQNLLQTYEPHAQLLLLLHSRDNQEIKTSRLQDRLDTLGCRDYKILRNLSGGEMCFESGLVLPIPDWYLGLGGYIEAHGPRK